MKQWVLAAALCLAVLPPVAGAADPLPSLALGPSETTPLVAELLAINPGGSSLAIAPTPVVPIWSGTSGQLLAIVALPPTLAIDGDVGTSLLPAWLSPEPALGGLRWRNGDGLYADAILGGSRPSFTACALSQRGCVPRFTSGTTSASLGLGWLAPDGSTDLSYGLSWLQSDRDNVATPVFGAPWMATEYSGYGLESQSALFARGSWKLLPDAGFDIGASYGRDRLQPFSSFALPGQALDLDQASLSLGVGAGSLHGIIIGHVMSSDDPALAGKRWTTIDLGVSWRTPWRGEFRFGAQNLWSAPLTPSTEIDPNQGRMPYIQYKQDL